MTEDKLVSGLVQTRPEQKDMLIEKLQEDLAQEKDKRREERFFGIVLLILIFDIVFFSVMPTFGGPLALLVLELLILIPLARRMGMEQIATMIDRVLGRIAAGAGREE